MVGYWLFAGRAAARDHLHFRYIKRGLSSGRCARAGCGGTAARPASSRCAGVRSRKADLMTNVIAQFGGVTGQLPGLPRLVSQGEVTGRTAQAAFNASAAVR